MENPRFDLMLISLQRAVLGHAWFEDQIFLPAFEAEPLLESRFVKEISQEHKDLDHLLKLLRKTHLAKRMEMEFTSTQFKALLTTHLLKEEDGLFPLTERILDEEGMNNLGAEMERRKMDVIKIFPPVKE